MKDLDLLEICAPLQASKRKSMIYIRSMCSGLGPQDCTCIMRDRSFSGPTCPLCGNICLAQTTTQLHGLSLISPYTAFSEPLPPPPQVSKQIIIQPDIERVSPQGTNFLVLDGLPSGAPHSPIHSAQWRECSHDKKRLQRTLDRFSRTLRSVHKRKINWPKNESFPNE